ncbi:MAG: flavin reductase [Eubacterium sp.]
MIDNASMFKLSYGLFVLTAKDEKDNGCIINTAQQLSSNPMRISVTVNKANLTHDMIKKTGEFNISVLTEETPFEVFQHYGFQSGKNTDKIAGSAMKRAENGIVYLEEYANAFISAKVVEMIDCNTHTLFIADVTQAEVINNKPSVTYQYYFDNIKPKPKKEKEKEKKKGFVCKICGYVYEGDELPEDFVCPVCKHGAADFEPIGE